jgi:hypothetical protein
VETKKKRKKTVIQAKKTKINKRMETPVIQVKKTKKKTSMKMVFQVNRGRKKNASSMETRKKTVIQAFTLYRL